MPCPAFRPGHSPWLLALAQEKAIGVLARLRYTNHERPEELLRNALFRARAECDVARYCYPAASTPMARPDHRTS